MIVCMIAFQSSAIAGNYNETNISEYYQKIEKLHTSDSEKKGLEIYLKQYLIDEGWKDMDTKMDMTLIDPLGRKSQRKVIKRTLEDGSNPDKTLGVFLEPLDIKGTVMLTYENSYGPDEQWLYLPSLKRTKKINAENKSGSFLGTEFSWEDISTTELSKYHYNYTGETDKHWIVEKTPNYEFSGYSKEVTMVNKTNYQTEIIEFYDKKGDLLKKLEMSKWEQYQDRYWRPRYFKMENAQNKRTTILEMSPYAVAEGLDTNTFSSLGLNRVSAVEAR